MTGPSDAMFAPLRDAELRVSEHVAPVDKSEASQPIVPVPIDVHDPDWHRLCPPDAKGNPVGTWTYLTADGEVAFHVARWENVDQCGRKVIRPTTWNGVTWKLKAMPAPRPLFNLPSVLEAPAKTIVVAEGERLCRRGGAGVPRPLRHYLGRRLGPRGSQTNYEHCYPCNRSIVLPMLPVAHIRAALIP